MHEAAFNRVVCQRNLSITLHGVAKFFGYEGSTLFAKKEFRHIVTYLVPYMVREPTAVDLLSDLSDLTKYSTKDLVKNSFSVRTVVFFSHEIDCTFSLFFSISS